MTMLPLSTTEQHHQYRHEYQHTVNSNDINVTVSSLSVNISIKNSVRSMSMLLVSVLSASITVLSRLGLTFNPAQEAHIRKMKQKLKIKPT